jgi:transposase
MSQKEIPATEPAEIETLRQRLRTGRLTAQDLQLLDRLLGSFLSLVNLLQQKNASIARLRRLLFGPRSDTRTAHKQEPGPSAETSTSPLTGSAPRDEPTTSASSAPSSTLEQTKRQRVGHGRRKAADYTSAEVVQCTDAELKAGDRCPHCAGHLYDTNAPSIFIRLQGHPIVGATRYEQQVLRCSACQERFTASLPESVSPVKYDPSADVAIALAKYGAGIPCYRLEQMQEACGVPLPESVQFERSEAVANALLPVFLQLNDLAACGEVLYSDDTRIRILDLIKENKRKQESERKGMQTSVVVAEAGTRLIALYFSGRRHAGENVARLLERRVAGLGAPIRMADALAANRSGKKEAIEEAKCLAHARRQFTDIESIYPQECGRVLDAIREAYWREAQTKGMGTQDRLHYHQEHSEPVMRELKEWVDKQFTDKTVEPHSSLGKALAYLQNHWEELTKFLVVEGCPIDNNRAERALKRVVLLRKNALFYKTEHGAAIGSIIQSAIETCKLNGVNVWQYLLEVVKNAHAVRKNPQAWLPWNYPRGEPSRLVA